MARLFGHEYHEHSNTWYYRSQVKPLLRDALSYTHFRDQNGRDILTFSASAAQPQALPGRVVITYNPATHQVEAWHCEACEKQDTCPHFLTVVHYAYQYIATEDIEGGAVRTFQSNLLQVNEFWQRILLNARILVSKLYDTTDRVRLHFRDYDPIDIRLVSLLAAGREMKNEDEKQVDTAQKQLTAFSSEERLLLETCQRLKCSFSRAGTFFTVYKADLPQVMPLLRNLEGKIYVEETGEKLVFEQGPLSLSLLVRRTEASGYMLGLAPGELVSACFVDVNTSILRRNVVHTIRLPFRPEVSAKILGEGYPLEPIDLVYCASVVARQLSLIGCYLDFEPGIALPAIFDTNPVVTMRLRREGPGIIVEGLLDYENGTLIPLSVIRFPTELVRVDVNGAETWFYIPPQVRHEVFRFVESLPDADTSRLDVDSTLVFTGETTIDNLKRKIFEDVDPAWHIELSEELKREFVYKVALQPEIAARTGDQIDWFDYRVTYRYQERVFTHEELRRFFRGKDKFLKLEDGRLLYFTNREAFQDVERIIRSSHKMDDESYRLEVYNIPYLYQLTNIRDGLRMHGDEYLQGMYDAILARRLPQETPIPAGLRSIMRSYQKRGFAWLKMLQRYHLAGVLADDMGLGKTLEAISVLSELPADSRSLVVCPKSLLYNWAAEIDKFNPALSHLIYEGGREDRMELLRQPRVNVMICSYAIVVNDLEELGKMQFDYIILDEAQQIKNAGAQRSKAVKRLRGRHRLALTGTPMENNPAELWSLFDFLMPGYLPPARRFRSEYADAEIDRQEKHERLAAIISPFLLRRKKKDVLIELPDKQVQVSYCHLTPLQEKLYLEIIESVKNSLLNRFDRFDPSQYIHVLAALTRLRQICNHPALVQPDLNQRIDMSGKLEQLVTLLDDALPMGSKVLLFSQFVETLKIIRKILVRRNVPFEYMDGDTKNRQERVDNFNNNVNIRVFLISLKTGGFGLNLTAADTVILLDPWWNPMGENQAIDRAHRIGQTKKVQVYKMITKGTVEEKILDLQQSKIEMFESIIEGGGNILSQLDAEELRSLFEYQK